jgi:hypothetical protein
MDPHQGRRFVDEGGQGRMEDTPGQEEDLASMLAFLVSVTGCCA